MSAKATGKELRKRPLFSQEIRDTIQRAILTEQLKPGDRVVETRWARELGVSQSPVREAIRELEMMGLVEVKPYQGAFVRTIDKSSIADTYNVRRGLESVGIEAAVEKITDQQLVEVYIIMREMEQAVKEGNYELFVEKDSLFHEKILQVSGNKLLLQLWNQCKIREFTRISTYLSKIGVDILAQRHGTMYDALAKRDTAAAVAAVNEHFVFLIEQLKGVDFEDLQGGTTMAIDKKSS